MYIITTSQTMNSNDLLDVINKARSDMGETEVRRNDFINRVKDEIDGDNYEIIVVRNQNGTESEVISLTHDQCILVSMRESKSVRRKILEMLQKLVDAQLPVIPKTMAQALRLAADQADQIEAQQAALALAAPKVAFVDNYVEATGLKGFRQVAKVLNIKEPEFRQFLTDNLIMYRLGGEWMAYQCHIDAGRFATKAGVSPSGHAYEAAKFTTKGVAWVAGLIASKKALISLT